MVSDVDEPAQGESCHTFTHGGFGRDRKATIVECTVHPKFVRKIRGDAKERAERATAVALEHVRSHA